MTEPTASSPTTPEDTQDSAATKHAVATGQNSAGLLAAQASHAAAKQEKPRGLWGDAWHDLLRRPMFLIASAIILVLLAMVAFPQLFTSVDPNHSDLLKSREGPSAEAWFGYDLQGRDIFARAVHGARASITVGLLATLGTVLIGSVVGILSGYYGGWVDNLLSRLSEIFLGLPFVLGAIVILTTFNSPDEIPSGTRVIMQVVISIAVLSWPIAMRIMRSAAISAKQQDYVKAARALGAKPSRVILRHMLPNCLAPVLVYATIALGGFIGAEATLSYLGLGLKFPVVSWGVMISDSREFIQASPHLLLFPAGFLVMTVLAFVMLGDAVRDALDPKQK
ncbi:MAG: ABC transporter permease [Saccharopolyspora sp.]|uniref:ABC transporter permease n=1 Tax=Saccharopolyspora sp. TaxID=33915 RepID=UPI00190BE19F|nr:MULTISPECIES: ABC transporter permease [unclassified Saccharopolyspora]MBK0866631.1 ABC transporter permease [Saccharopolyspora sp. HNM0986]MBQ6642817.1 ABC transporter permease [Saccharopolyspora sp.]